MKLADSRLHTLCFSLRLCVVARRLHLITNLSEPSCRSRCCSLPRPQQQTVQLRLRPSCCLQHSQPNTQDLNRFCRSGCLCIISSNPAAVSQLSHEMTRAVLLTGTAVWTRSTSQTSTRLTGLLRVCVFVVHFKLSRSFNFHRKCVIL